MVGRKKLRRKILVDKEFRHHYEKNTGIDLLGKQGTHIPGTFFGIQLDPYYFFYEPEIFPEEVTPNLKIVE